jgi:lysozyme
VTPAPFDLAVLEAELRRDEGFRSRPYPCPAGFQTIGFGRNLDANPLSEDEGAYLLRNDIRRAAMGIAMRLPGLLEQVGDVRARVLLNMAVNLGVGGLLKFRRMLVALEQGDYGRAADEMLDSVWARQVGRRADRLADAMRTGEVR